MPAKKSSSKQRSTRSRSRAVSKVSKTKQSIWWRRLARSKPILFVVTFAVLGVAWIAFSQAAPVAREYPWHHNITATTFWVGENFRGASDGSQVCSAYQGNWAQLWAPEEDTISTLRDSTDCSGSPIGGCDGKRGGIIETSDRRIVDCQTEKRTKRADGLDYFPSWTTATKQPRENPFYLDLPYNDTNEGYSDRCNVIPWKDDPGFAGNCNKSNFSYMKNRWVEIRGPNGNTCYGQIQDAGPSDDESSDRLKYKDAPYVFGTSAPSNRSWNNAGMDVSPALNGCLGFRELEGLNDKVSWRWVEAANVPEGPWTKKVTTSQANWGGNVNVTPEYIRAITPGGSTTPTPVANTAPTVSLSSPQTGSAQTAPAAITLNASASDEDGIRAVDFYQGSTKLGTDTTAPYSYTVSNVAAGTYVYTAVATDRHANPLSTTSAAISVKVNEPVRPPSNDPPVVSISSPQAGTSPTAPATVTLNAHASDSNGIRSVQFYMDGVAVGRADTSAPYSTEIKNIAAGTHSFYAVATDNSNDRLMGQSQRISLTVKSAPTGGDNDADNQAPTDPSHITASLVFDWGYKMNVGWKASRDNSGKVSYLVNWTGNKTPVVTTQPYYTFSTNAVSPYTVTVQAVDAAGNKSSEVKATFTPKCFIIWCWL